MGQTLQSSLWFSWSGREQEHRSEPTRQPRVLAKTISLMIALCLSSDSSPPMMPHLLLLPPPPPLLSPPASAYQTTGTHQPSFDSHPSPNTTDFLTPIISRDLGSEGFYPPTTRPPLYSVSWPFAHLPPSPRSNKHVEVFTSLPSELLFCAVIRIKAPLKQRSYGPVGAAEGRCRHRSRRIFFGIINTAGISSSSASLPITSTAQGESKAVSVLHCVLLKLMGWNFSSEPRTCRICRL